jgi:diguanylate cyclase (GGDEF)-like protein
MIRDQDANAPTAVLIRERARVFFLIGLPVIAVFALTGILSGEWPLFWLMVTLSIPIGLGFLQLRRGESCPITIRFGLACFTATMLYLVAFPGPDYARLLWFYTLPLLAIMLTEPRLGFAWTATSLVAAVAIMVFGPKLAGTVDYSTPLMLRFAFTMTLITGGLYWTERALRRFQEETTVQQFALEAERARLNQEVARRTALEKELRQQATTDALTGLSNRRVFMERLEQEVARSQRHGPMPTLLILDIDHFKKINDKHGHPAGDAVIVHLAQLLRASVRNVDIVGRIGGEEFAVVLVETDGKMSTPVIDRLIERIRVTDVTLPDGGKLKFTASVGSTEVQWGDVIGTAIQRADDALYEAKNSGRNRHCRH